MKLVLEMVAFGGEQRNLGMRIKKRRKYWKGHLSVLKVSSFLWVNKVANKYCVILFNVSGYGLTDCFYFFYVAHKGGNSVLNCTFT
jgi:hypothetical protein